jgi:cytochrome c-type biogenesis protein CcmH
MASRPLACAMRAIVIALAAMTALHDTGAKEAAPASSDPVIEARMIAITSELRCLVCQNQTIADSHADLAQDLREEVRSLLRQGRSDREVVDYMTARYGDFVLYRPPVKPATLLLWFGPGALMIGGLAALLWLLRRRARLGDEYFEPDEVAGFDGQEDLRAEEVDPTAEARP